LNKRWSRELWRDVASVFMPVKAGVLPRVEHGVERVRKFAD
jgi:hypothetical protein